MDGEMMRRLRIENLDEHIVSLTIRKNILYKVTQSAATTNFSTNMNKHLFPDKGQFRLQLSTVNRSCQLPDSYKFQTS